MEYEGKSLIPYNIQSRIYLGCQITRYVRIVVVYNSFNRIEADKDILMVYTKEVRDVALKLLLENDLSFFQITQETGVPRGTLHGWKKK